MNEGPLDILRRQVNDLRHLFPPCESPLGEAYSSCSDYQLTMLAVFLRIDKRLAEIAESLE